ncbi:MAG: dihydroxyacetone kinase subunit DhaL [Oscillospiraceae bacterium]|nr:dihydroxyacetone kinase subunit DhaL [Oscillospiraceae bacterium]
MPKTNQDVIELLKKIEVVIHDNKDYLTELDQPIGDSDHGINMDRGFKKVLEKLPECEGKDVGSTLKAVGMALVTTVGGASGPLYGTAFMKAGAAVAGKESVDGNDFLAILNAAIEGIMSRGKSTTGEKTMLDALVPARDAFEKEYSASGDYKAAIGKATEAAEAGCEYTKTIIATKGRASYLGERGIGHQDPGATSSTLMLEVLRDNA